MRELRDEGRITNVELSRRIGMSTLPCLTRVNAWRMTASSARLAIVREAWMVSGESNFLLHCVASDLGAFQSFQSFVIEELASRPMSTRCAPR